MRVPLARLWLRARKPRRRQVTLRPIVVPATFASDLYASAYADVIRQWEAALPAIAAAYERTLSQITTDAPADIEAEIDRAASVTTVFLRPALARWAERIERWQRQRWRAAVLTATGVDLGTMIGPGDVRTTLETAIERNVALVRSVSDEARRRISEAVFSGLTERKPAVAVAKEIREAVGMARDRAKRIASDQLSKVSSQLNEERRRQAGISEFVWVASGKVNYREEHRARDGKIYSDDKPPPEMPGQLIGCGCTSRAHLNIESMLAELDVEEAA